MNRGIINRCVSVNKKKKTYKDFIRFNVVKREKFSLVVCHSVEFRFSVNQHANNGQVAVLSGEMKWRTATTNITE